MAYLHTLDPNDDFNTFSRYHYYISILRISRLTKCKLGILSRPMSLRFPRVFMAAALRIVVLRRIEQTEGGGEQPTGCRLLQ